MKKVLFNLFLVTVGAAVGSAVTWKVIKDKYERITQEEIDSVKEEYQYLRDLMCSDEKVSLKSHEEHDDDVEKEDVFEPTNDELFNYHDITSAYRSSENIEEKNDEEGGTGDSDDAPYINGPYVISPDDFRCSPPGYNAQALDYFADGVLADGWGVEMDIENTIGEESLNHFGDYVDEIVYVRNERLEVDYEVTCDSRKYSDVYDPAYNA